MPTPTDGTSRPPCPACQGLRVHKLTWAIKSQKNEVPFDGPVTWECMSCGHVWRLDVTAHEARRSVG